MKPKTTFAGGIIPAWANVPNTVKVVEKIKTVPKPRKVDKRVEIHISNMTMVYLILKKYPRLTLKEILPKVAISESQVKEAVRRLVMNGKVRHAHVYAPVEKLESKWPH